MKAGGVLLLLLLSACDSGPQGVVPWGRIRSGIVATEGMDCNIKWRGPIHQCGGYAWKWTECTDMDEWTERWVKDGKCMFGWWEYPK